MSLCSAGGHWWEVQRRETPGGHGNLAALEAAEVADISVRLMAQGTLDLPLTLAAKASPSPEMRLWEPGGPSLGQVHVDTLSSLCSSWKSHCGRRGLCYESQLASRASSQCSSFSHLSLSFPSFPLLLP